MSDPIVIAEELDAPLVVLRRPAPVAVAQASVPPVLVDVRGPGILVDGAEPLVVVSTPAPIAVAIKEATVAPVLVGVQGPAGRDGLGAPLEFGFDTPSARWVCNHGLGRLPAVTVYDLAGNLRPLVPIANPDLNTTVLAPNPPLAGRVVLL